MAFNVNNDNALQYSQKNDILPLYVLYGSDSLEEIGDPKVISSTIKDPSTLWELTLQSVFPSESEGDTNEVEDLERKMKDKYKETRIDTELSNFE